MEGSLVLKWGALVVFAVQNAGAVLLMRYSKLLNGPPYDNLAAVLMQELVKLGVCTVLYALECGGVLAMARSLRADLRENAVEWLQLAVPALLYTLQNTMLFVGAQHLEAAIQLVTYQSKIFFTALFSVALLGKRLSPNQWISLALLVLGVLFVQGIGDMVSTPPGAAAAAAAATSPPSAAPSLVHGHHAAGHRGHHAAHRAGAGLHNLLHNRTKGSSAHGIKGTAKGMAKGGSTHGSRGHRAAAAAHVGRQLAAAVQQQSFTIGVGAMLTAAVCSSFASVYFERMLKGAKKPSLWLRNIQLASYCSLIALVSLQISGRDDPHGEGLLHGFNRVTWAVVLMQSVGGIVVAICIKYADNILRTFAQTVAVILGAFGSFFLFDFRFTRTFNVGMVFVVAAILLYGGKATTPLETLACCAGGGA